jgi:serine/threonine-protein kinase RsbW
VEIKLVLFLPRDAASVPVIRQVLDGCLDVLGVATDTRTDIALALGEACANVIQHAGPGEEYEVTARVTSSRCIIEVVNTGTGTDPVTGGAAAGSRAAAADHAADDAADNPATAEHGRGLKIMTAVVDEFQLTSAREGTTVHLEKDLRWEPGSAGEQLSHSEG